MFGWPSLSDWRLVGVQTLLFSALAGAFALTTFLFEFSLISDLSSLLKITAIALFLPAIFEELVFRGPVIWVAEKHPSWLWPASGVSLVLFVLWHPLNGMFLMTEARELFTDARFLMIAAALGAMATLLGVRTRSIWPPVVFHWLVVIGWKAFLGGPQFLS